MNQPPGYVHGRAPAAGWRRVGLTAITAAIAGGVLVGLTMHSTRPAAPAAPENPSAEGHRLVHDEPLWTSPHVSFAELSWSDYHGVSLPRSVQDGPRDMGGELAAGFSRTARGALLAALHIAVRANAQWGPRVFEPTIQRQVTGPDAATLLASTRTLYVGQRERARVAYGTALGRAYSVLEGFRWLGYSPEVASLDLVSAGPGDSDATVRAVTRIQLQWRDGDWRVVAPPGGTWGGSAASVDSLDGYLRFPDGSG
ncbi:hypothetical protein [Actinomadura fibrosa]|uniref:DUF8175 domain-containing protein n=1 Tax=Actinomadura fibrosa TaxID=111802 RepID=A0ABW2Y3U5_9ACTN|nr:hypothetical protein [Actinomadura fibrosa]